MSRHWFKRFIRFANIPTFDPRSFEKRVHANGRASNDRFSKYELLYRRFDPDQHLIDNVLSPLAFQFPRQSVNRGKYSKRLDVLHKDCCDGKDLKGWRVASLFVRDLPSVLASGDGRVFHFSMRHTPKTCCYPHSEMWCETRVDDALAYQKPPKNVRETFRARLAQRADY
jgi:hypothetical protein